jgi:hypothetical protein
MLTIINISDITNLASGNCLGEAKTRGGTAYDYGECGLKRRPSAPDVAVSRKIAPLAAIKGTDDDSHLSRDMFRSSNCTT